MPLFRKKKPKGAGSEQAASETTEIPDCNTVHSPSVASTVYVPQESTVHDDDLSFHVYLAHDESNSHKVKGFSSVFDLYTLITEAFKIDINDIIFCTVNTPMRDFGSLLSKELTDGDIIYAHVKGESKEVKFKKFEDSFGVTLMDNGTGQVFIKGKRPNSIVCRISDIVPGDHIVSINGSCMIGCRHYDVARFLKKIPKNSNVVFKLIAPLYNTNDIPEIEEPKIDDTVVAVDDATIQTNDIVTTKVIEGKSIVEDAPVVKESKGADILTRLDDILEGFMGIRDKELATELYEYCSGCDTSTAYTSSINESPLGDFGFPNSFILDAWNIISEERVGLTSGASE